MHAKTTFGKKDPIYLSLKEEEQKPGLAFQLALTEQGEWFLEKAKGVFKGIDLSLNKKGNAPSGGAVYDVILQADLSQARVFFPKTWNEGMKKWNLGAGYRYTGDVVFGPNFSLVSLLGEIQGEQFICFNRPLALLHAGVTFQKDRGQIKDFSLTDQAGSVQIKTIDVIFDSLKDTWDVSIPIVHIKDLSPSLLFQGKANGTLLNNISLHRIKGVFGEVNSFEAEGSLHFSTQVKKELSLWDIPISLVKDLGLDSKMLTPVSGEADLNLKDGRLYFSALHNVYSEGERSQFFLAPSQEGAYLSVNGDVYVDLQMKQKVKWKVGESFLLSVRGTVDKPKYNVKLKK